MAKADRTPYAVYEIGGQLISMSDSSALDALEHAHRHRMRPRCVCRPEGAPMYVARLGEGFIVKRMPETGDLHAPGCPSHGTTVYMRLHHTQGRPFDPPEDNRAADTIALAFPLASAMGEAHAQPSRHPHDRHADRRLSLSALLRLLWDRAGLNEWRPAFAGKRNWAVVRWRLLKAAEGLMLRSGESLTDSLYIPEVFSIAQRDAINERREARWAGFASQGLARRLLIIAEVKDVMPSPMGHTILLKQLPDLSFPVTDPSFAATAFTSDSRWRGKPPPQGVHTIVIGTLIVTSRAKAVFRSLATQHLSFEWLPPSTDTGGPANLGRVVPRSSSVPQPVATSRP